MIIKNTYPLFARGRVLKLENFNYLRDNALEILKQHYIELENGIISGFNLKAISQDKIIEVSSGLIAYEKNLYYIKDDFKIDMPEEEDTYVIKFVLNTVVEEKERFIREIEIVTTKITEEIKENEIELVRFTSRIGADLRNDYKDFSDYNTPFNTLHIINAKYACYHKDGTLSKELLFAWAKEAVEKENLDIYDINLIGLCESRQVTRHTLINYINRKEKEKKENYTNSEIYEKLLIILNNLRNERELKQYERYKPKKIIVD